MLPALVHPHSCLGRIRAVDILHHPLPSRTRRAAHAHHTHTLPRIYYMTYTAHTFPSYPLHIPRTHPRLPFAFWLRFHGFVRMPLVWLLVCVHTHTRCHTTLPHPPRTHTTHTTRDGRFTLLGWLYLTPTPNSRFHPPPHTLPPAGVVRAHLLCRLDYWLPGWLTARCRTLPTWTRCGCYYDPVTFDSRITPLPLLRSFYAP